MKTKENNSKKQNLKNAVVRSKVNSATAQAKDYDCSEDNNNNETATLMMDTFKVIDPSQTTQKISPIGNLDSYSCCIRYVLIIGNCIFFFLGCTIIGLSIYIVVDKVDFVTGLFGPTLVAPGSYVIITSGCVVFVISFVGCFGALFESRSLLTIYSSALAVVLVLSCIGFSFAVLFRSIVTDQLREYMRRTLKNDYGVNTYEQWNKFVTERWNKAQHKWQCCGVRDNTWSIYSESSWYNNTVAKSFEMSSHAPLVPKSCCKRNNNNDDYVNSLMCQQKLSSWIADMASVDSTIVDYNGDTKKVIEKMSNFTEFKKVINTKGCYEVGKNVVFEISGYLICIGVITAAVVIGGLVLSIQLTRKV